jgi:L-fuculose-phosphate aldolase
MEYLEIREQMCDIGRRVWQQGWAAANDGNFTVKLGEDLFMATPTGTSKGFLTPEMLILVDSKCRPLEDSKWRPSSELPMHMRCYKERPDIGAAVHAHPPVSTAFAVAHIPLDGYLMPEAILTLGSVPIAPYGCPSTDEIPDAVAPFLQEHDAVLLENHGAITVGADLMTAYYRMETLEYFAKLTMNTITIGKAYELSQDRLEELMELRKRFGFTGRHPGIKKYH